MKQGMIFNISRIAIAILASACAVPAEPWVNILPRPEKVEVREGTHRYKASEDIKLGRSNLDLGREGYELEIGEGGIEIRANGKPGEFYARQSLSQLIGDSEGGILPCVQIVDRPKYAWRGFMIDSGRQYQRMETIKGLLDRMAMLKMNVFHWHLTENDGWRIEIKKYPQLTQVGAFVADGREQQGFYTREDIREIVRYAAERQIMVVPEIDIPGHADAALEAYPEMTCSGQPPKSHGGHSPYLFCGGREDVDQFLFDILDEVCELFPSEYIHIGGDEAPKSEWRNCAACRKRMRELGLKNAHELQIAMSNRLARHLAKRGRKAICWSDVVTIPGQKLEGNVVIQWWNWRGHKDEALRQAIRRKIKVIASPNYYSYLNFPETEPWKGYQKNRTFDLRTCYERNPGDRRKPDLAEREALLGMECCLWTDYNLTEDLLDKRIFPRIFALAEQMWSQAERLPFDEFKERICAKRESLAEQGIRIDSIRQ